MKQVVCGGFVGLVVGVLVFGGPAALSHGAYSNFAVAEWKRNSSGGVLATMRCDASMPGGACGSGFVDQAYDGLRTWNGLAPVGGDNYWAVSSKTTWEDDATYTQCPGPWSDFTVGTFYESIDGTGDVLAVAGLCTNANGKITQARIRFDSAENWDTNGTVTESEHDTRGVSAHEIGHGAGIFRSNDSTTCRKGHWDGGAANNQCAPTLCTGADSHTMCKSLPVGATRWRSLEPHDEHTFTTVFGP